MALFGSISTVRSQLAASPRFNTAFAYLDRLMTPGSAEMKRLLSVAVGKTERIELEGGVFALEQAYTSKLRPDGFFESHRAYIDIQVIVSGEELMEVADVTQLVVAEDFTPAKDLIKYRMFNQASVLRVGSGQAAIFFPIDGHMPSLAVSAPAVIYKTVIKVPVA